MELHAEHVVARDGRGERATVVAGRDRSVVRGRGIAVYEIEPRVAADAVERTISTRRPGRPMVPAKGVAA